MVEDVQIVRAVCELLEHEQLKARDLVKKLSHAGISIERQDLNSTLYRMKAATPGLSVDRAGVWTYRVPGTSKAPPDEAARASKTASKVAPKLVPVGRAADGGPRVALRSPSAAPPPPSPFVSSPEQRAIIEAPPTQWTLVDAGPGTGKTAVALARVGYLLDHGMAANSILMVSFTRTAIAELRQRIEALTKDVAAVAAVRVTTLDSEAWNLGVGFRGGTAAEKLVRGFDVNIEDAIGLFAKDDPALCDWMKHTRHLLIDEAQDLVGRRAELVFQILDHLPESCGVTVFADPAQAIFGFASGEDEDDDAADAAPALPFHQQLLQEFPEVFEQRCLTKLYRSSTPELQTVFEQGRVVVQSASPPDQRAAGLRNLASKLCAPTGKVEERPEFAADELILFRRRSEVLMASSFLATNRKPHRIRMAHTSVGVQPWVAVLFGTESVTAVTRAEFDRRWGFAGTSPHLRGLANDRVWKVLLRLAGTSDGMAVDVRVLRRLLGRARPPVELTQTEVGMEGPILGTIHASKGREANTVSLMLSPSRADAAASASDEEVRVTYVGTTRARHKLLVGTGYAGFAYRGLGRGGRVYRAFGAKEAASGQVQVELGRPGDVDELSVVGKALATAQSARGGQEFLANYAGQVVPLSVTAQSDYRYALRTSEGISLGLLSEAVNRDLFGVAEKVDPRKRRRPPDSIPHVTLIGVRAYALADDHTRLAEVHEPWATTGIFLVPVIRGLAKILLPAYGQRGNR